MSAMSHLTTLDLDSWPRRSHFEHFRTAVPCTFSVTSDLDVTKFVEWMSESDRKTYPTQVWAISSVINNHEEFRMALDSEGNPAVYDVVHPSFTVFNEAADTFSSLWVPYRDRFDEFHDDAIRAMTTHRGTTEIYPQGKFPHNVFDVSSIPWTSFTGFNLNVRDGWDHLAPIITLGKYRRVGQSVYMPVSVQIHHAAADGFHVSRLINELQDMFSIPEWVG